MQQSSPLLTKNETSKIRTVNNDTILVIPTHNDELTIGSIILKAKPLVSRIIVVDDGSKDRTSEVAHLAGADVILLQKNSGKGQAVIAGLKRAYDFGCRVAVLIDGDGRYKTRQIPWITTRIINGEADLVIGSRYLENNGNIPLKQQIKQQMIKLPDGADSYLNLTDPLSGFMAFSKKALEHLNFSFEKSRFHQNLFLHFVSEHLTIREIPITEHPGIAPKIGWDYSSTIIAALPAYNEEKYIAKIISQAKLFVDTVLVVDDGSTDETQMIARQMGAYVIRHEKNLGYGAALQTIFAAARDLNADVLVTMDADGQHDPQDITRVLEPLLFGADVVIGSRFIGKTKNNIPSYRKVGMKVLDHATNIAGVKKVTDTQSGFRAYSKKAIDVVAINSAGMSVGSEILIQISDYPLKIAEVPITAIYDTKDTSTHNPLSHGISVLGRIIALISYRRPLPAFGIPGLILFIIGVAGSILAFFNYQITEHFPIPLSLLSAIILFLGLILGITGLILNALIVITGEHRK